jgi:hypothetical protein
MKTIKLYLSAICHLARDPCNPPVPDHLLNKISLVGIMKPRPRLALKLAILPSLMFLPQLVIAADMSEGLYRIPFQDGTEVVVTRDHIDHRGHDKIDMVGNNGNFVVAAADGIVRFVVDDNDINCSNDEDSNLPPGTECSDFNNYVWIEHPNGEWTRYAHLQFRSVSEGANLGVGDHVRRGTLLGFEGNTGFANGTHLHFEVGVPSDPANPINLEGGSLRGENLIPRMCDIVDNAFETGLAYVAADCSEDSRKDSESVD